MALAITFRINYESMKKLYALLLLLSFMDQSDAQNPVLIKQVDNLSLSPNTTSAGTDLSYRFQKSNGKLFYKSANGTGLNVTDGTTAGTVNIYTFTKAPGSSFLSFVILGAAQDFMYLLVTSQWPSAPNIFDTPTQQEIWKSDGTTLGTQLVFSMNNTLGTVSYFVNTDRPALGILGNTLFFSNTTSAFGNELWKTDGTTPGTVIVKDIYPGALGSRPLNFGRAGNNILFYANDGITGPELWGTDGTEAGTLLIKDINPDNTNASGSGFVVGGGNVAVLNGKHYFTAFTPTAGAETWVSDGTEAGTFLLKDINPGTGGSKVPGITNDFLTTNDYMFFRTTGGNNSSRKDVWRTDGTPNGTILLSTVDSVSTNGGGASTGGNKFFLIYGSSTNALNYVLLSDGTINGTLVVDSLLYGATAPIVYKGAGYFSSGRKNPFNTSFSDMELSRTDGLKDNTGTIADIYPGTSFTGFNTLYNSSQPQKFFTLNNFLYFFAKTAAVPYGLYRYDGDFTFNGSVAGGRWRDSANWNSNVPPGITDTVYINAGTPNAVNITGRKAYAGVLWLGANAIVSLPGAADSLVIHSGLQTSGGNGFTGNGVVVLKSTSSSIIK